MENKFYSIKKKLAIIFTVFIPLYSYSQLTNWKNYTNKDAIHEIINDNEYLWLATDGGLIKLHKNNETEIFYDRANANLPENFILKLAKDIHGNIWMGSENFGIGKLEGNKCTVYNTINSKLPSDNMCDAIEIDKKNNIWIGSNGWLSKFDGKQWEAWTTPNSSIVTKWLIHAIKIDKNNILWLGGTFGTSHLAKFDGTEIQFIEGVYSNINGIDFDATGTMWLSTTNGLVKYDGNNFTNYNTQNSAIPANNLYDIKIDNNDNLWLACDKYLVKFDRTDFIKYQIPWINDETDIIYCIELDEDNTIWLGTRRNGLIKYFNGEFKKVNTNNCPLITNSIGLSAIIDNKENFWFGTEHNLVKIDINNNWYTYLEKIDNTTGQFRINGVGCDPSENIWVALGRSDTCILKIEQDKTIAFTRKDIPLFKQFIQSQCDFAFDKKGNTWIGTYGGLYKYDGKEWTLYSPKNTPLPSYTIFNLTVDKDDNLWGSAGDETNSQGGLFKYDGKEWQIYTPTNSGLPTKIVSAFAFDSKNNIWLSCRDNGNSIGRELGAGLTKFDGNTWTTYNIRNSGLPSNSILDIVIDKKDNLWLATYGGVGITKFDGENWTSYNMDNSGIAYNEVNKITLDYDRDLIWLNHMDFHGLSTAKLNWAGAINNTFYTERKGFTVSPNPATLNKSISLHFNKATELTGIEICTTSGQLIGAIKLNKVLAAEYSLSLPELNIQQNGIYIIKVITDEGIYTNKIWVNK